MAPSDSQLWLFPQPKPLRDRLGEDFFQGIPKVPGVYIMTDQSDRVLYVGQSNNLRRRLASYKNIRPEKDPRRLVRLACAATRITWEQCASADEARLRENELLRLYRPKFNRANTRPEAYGFIHLRVDAQALQLGLTQSRDGFATQELYGAFKGSRLGAYASLVRLLSLGLSHGLTPELLPLRLLGQRPPRRVRLDLGRLLERDAGCKLPDAVKPYLEGRSDQLLEVLESLLPPRGTWSPFFEALRASDLETLASFYERGCRRNWQYRQRYGLESRLISPVELDDLPILTRADIESES